MTTEIQKKYAEATQTYLECYNKDGYHESTNGLVQLVLEEHPEESTLINMFKQCDATKLSGTKHFFLLLEKLGISISNSVTQTIYSILTSQNKPCEVAYLCNQTGYNPELRGKK